MVVVAQAAHRLAEGVSVRVFVEFCVVFALVWIAWVNGSVYLELHGREDGRTRIFVFFQMGIVALLAVFTSEAAGATGQAFAVVYAAFLVVLTWLWYSVRLQDRQVRPEFLAVTGAYVAGGAVSVVVIFGSAFLPSEPRLMVWAGFAVAWVAAIIWVGRQARPGLASGVTPTESLVERFGLFTIIVLGEVVFGVVEGLSVAEHDVVTLSTGILALLLGFGFWWMYFDVIGRRMPRYHGLAVATWVLSHLPITLAIAAAGAAMIGLIEHAHDAQTPEGTAWLLAGAVALGLVAQAVAARTLEVARRLTEVYTPVSSVMVGGAVAAVIVGVVRPAPWLLALVLVAIFVTMWLVAVNRFLRAGIWGEAGHRSD